MKAYKFTVIVAVCVMFCIPSAFAGPYGTNITKYDGIATSPQGIGIGNEDNETGPSMVASQAWDLEAFFLDGKKLSIVGGYNFYTGKENMKAGDIFIDTNGDATYSPAQIPGGPYSSEQVLSNSLFKYDYVLDIDWAAGTFRIIALNDNSQVKLGYYGSTWNMPSNPWVYVPPATGESGLLYSGSFTTYGGYSQSDTGLSGWGTDNNHFVATFNLGTYVNLSKGALFHNTMECGNDNLLGQTAAVPEPTTLMLLGLGLVGLGISSRKFKK